MKLAIASLSIPRLWTIAPQLFATGRMKSKAARCGRRITGFTCTDRNLAISSLTSGREKEDTITFSSAVGPPGRVIAIEAHPVTFRCLQLFCEMK
jgi:hypothetical protein